MSLIPLLVSTMRRISLSIIILIDFDLQVWAVVQGMDGGGVGMGGDGEKNKDALAGSSTVGLLHNKVSNLYRVSC